MWRRRHNLDVRRGLDLPRIDRPTGGQHGPDGLLTQGAGDAPEQLGLVLVDRAHGDQDKRIGALSLPTGGGRPGRVVQLRTCQRLCVSA